MALPHAAPVASAGLTGRTDAIDIEALRAATAGRVIVPGDPDYDARRQVQNAMFDRRPALIVEAAGTEDVARVVRLAAETGLELAVRSGGHSSAGHSVSDDGIMLDLSAMRAIEAGTRVTLPAAALFGAAFYEFYKLLS